MASDMIRLDDPIWNELRHAYGAATEIPNQIRRAENARRLSRAFWDDLGNALCHQCTIGSASLAAFPHLVRIADQNRENRKGYDALHLSALILACALSPENNLPRMDRLFSVPFRQAIIQGRGVLAGLVRQERKPFAQTMDFLAMVAAFQLRADVAGLLWELRGGKFHCPAVKRR